jgi:hypothetical protein
MDVHEWIWYLLTLRTTAIWTATPELNDESQMIVRREARKMSNYLEDEERNRRRIINIVQRNERFHEITSEDMITKVELTERLQIDENRRGNDSNVRAQVSIGAYEDDSLLSVPFLNNVITQTRIEWADMTDESDDEISGLNEDLESPTLMVEEENEGPLIKGGVKERFKAMIADGLEMNHWDKEELMCLSVRKELSKSFAHCTVDNIIINEDLKFNLQQAIYAGEVKFNVNISKKNKVIEDTQISIQKLIYLCERRKKKREIRNQLSKAEKVDYQD